jgi:hypothetical protein
MHGADNVPRLYKYDWSGLGEFSRMVKARLLFFLLYSPLDWAACSVDPYLLASGPWDWDVERYCIVKEHQPMVGSDTRVAYHEGRMLNARALVFSGFK